MLSWFFKPPSKHTKEATSETKVSGDDQRTNYMSWTQSWLSWLKASTPASGMADREGPEVVEDKNALCAELMEEERKRKLMDVERERKAEFLRALRLHLETHSEQRMSQLPLVGMVHRNSRRGLISGPRLIEHVYDTTKAKVMKLCNKDLISEEKSSDVHSLETLGSRIASESSESDLACIEEMLYSCQSSQRENLCKLYMLVDWDTRPVDIPPPPPPLCQNSSVLWLDTEKHIAPRLLRLKAQLEGMKAPLGLNLEYFREELVLESYCDTGDPTVVQEAMQNAVDAGKDLYSKVIKHFPSKHKPNNYPDFRSPEKSLASGLKLDLHSWTWCVDISGFSCTNTHKRPVDLTVITRELAKIVSVSSCWACDESPRNGTSGKL